jgi:carboxylesterase
LKLAQVFQGEEHQSFILASGAPQALLVHGFPGTPAEMRPLAESLHRAGWTVHGLLLPGHGVQIETLFDHGHADRVAAVGGAVAGLQQDSHPVLLIGYSLGAALALQTAVANRPTALVLLAPFWQLGTLWQQWLGFLLKPIFRRMRPFQKADFTNPQVRYGLGNLLPGIDLNDPEVQQTLRDLAIPTSIFAELHAVGRAAYRLAPHAALPTLIVQGLRDEVVRPELTRRLLQRLPGPLRYEEVFSGHYMIHPGDAGWPNLEQAVLQFASTFQV